jgi:drug/metabolite transporter (DMT)-like permease
LLALPNALKLQLPFQQPPGNDGILPPEKLPGPLPATSANNADLSAGKSRHPVSQPHQSRPLDPFAVAIVVALCLTWGFNQVAVKIALHDIPPFLQSTVRSVIAVVLVSIWIGIRGIPLFHRDGTLPAGMAVGLLFALEFLLLFPGLLFTTATRAVLFLYTAPFMVVIALRWLMPADHFGRSQWIGLILSFLGIVIAFGLPTPAADPRQMLGDLMCIGAAAAWAGTTLIIKVSRLNRVTAEKTMLYQLIVSVPLLGLAAILTGEHIDRIPSAPALGALAFQAVWVVSITYVAWFALITRYSASRLSAFTFLTPLFGVAAGHFALGEPLNPPFAVAVALVATGLVLVNRPR